MAATEGALELYAEADDPARPRANFDECSVELHADARGPLPPAPGRPARIDYEYVRNGTANRFAVVGPTGGRRHVTVTERRTKADSAAQMKYLRDVMYPEARAVRVVGWRSRPGRPGTGTRPTSAPGCGPPAATRRAGS